MIKAFFIAFTLMTLTACQGNPEVQTLNLNFQGNRALKAQNLQEAYGRYLEALRFDPFLPQLHLNLGLTFEFMQQPDKAMQSYRQAEALADKQHNLPVLFMARFNQAQLLGKDKKVDEALAIYQKALEVVPTSKETKINIELLTQAQQGQGGGEGKDQNKDNKDKKDSKGQGDNKDDKKDQKDDKDKDDKDKDNKDKQDKKYQNQPKYQPKPFSGKNLNEADVKKILGEIKQQEQKIRADFNRKEVKEQPRDKDW